VGVRLSIVLPCFNEAENLPLVLSSYRELQAEAGFELILVDNGSSDGTAAFLEKELAKPEYSFARQLRLAVNQGYGAGLKAGLAECAGAVAAFSHADMQCSPRDVFRALSLFDEAKKDGPVLVKGRRVNRRGLDAFISAVYGGLSRRALGLAPSDVNAQPKLFSRSLLPSLRTGPDDMTFDLFVLRQAARAGARFLEFDVDFGARAHGESKWASNPLAKARGIFCAMNQMMLIRKGHYDRP